MTLDRRTLQVLYNHCAAAADAMAFTLMRTAHSTFVKETEDFSCTILDAEGHAVASPRSFGAPWYSGIDYGPVLRMIDAYEEGDTRGRGSRGQPSRGISDPPGSCLWWAPGTSCRIGFIEFSVRHRAPAARHAFGPGGGRDARRRPVGALSPRPADERG